MGGEARRVRGVKGEPFAEEVLGTGCCSIFSLGREFVLRLSNGSWFGLPFRDRLFDERGQVGLSRSTADPELAHHGEEVGIQRRVDPDERAVHHVAVQGAHDAPDVQPGVKEADAAGEGDGADDVESVALEPPAHVECGAGRGHLVQTLAEDAGAVVDVGFVGDERGHGEGGLVLAALLGVMVRVAISEEGCGPAGDAPAGVPGGLGEVGAMAVDGFGGDGVVDAVFVWAVAHDWAWDVRKGRGGAKCSLAWFAHRICGGDGCCLVRSGRSRLARGTISW